MDFLIKIIEKLQRKRQLSILRNHSKSEISTKIKIGKDNTFILYPNLKSIIVKSGFSCRNFVHFIIQNNAELEIGENVFINNFCSINCLEKISIGDNTLLGENVKIYDHNHAYNRSDNQLDVSHTEFTKSPITIGKNCWLGSNVTILKGVTIGDNCIIGAGCTIAKDIPSNSTIINQQNLISKIN